MMGNGHKITFFAAGDFTGANAEKFLRGYGVRVWGRDYVDMSDGDDAFYGLTVRKAQAKWAASLMLTAGYPIRSGADGVRPMSGLPKTSWNSIAPAAGPIGAIVQMFTGTPRAQNTIRRARRGFMRELRSLW